MLCLMEAEGDFKSLIRSGILTMRRAQERFIIWQMDRFAHVSIVLEPVRCHLILIPESQSSSKEKVPTSLVTVSALYWHSKVREYKLFKCVPLESNLNYQENILERGSDRWRSMRSRTQSVHSGAAYRSAFVFGFHPAITQEHAAVHLKLEQYSQFSFVVSDLLHTTAAGQWVCFRVAKS